MRLRLYCLIGSLLLIAVFSRCGNPAAPQPPSLQLALPVNDLTATRKGNRVELEWTLQRKNTDRTLVRHLPGIRICRHEGTGLMSNCDVVAEVPPPKLAPQLKLKPTEEVPSIQMNYVDPLPPQLGQENPAGFVTYAVEEVNSHGRSAGLSNQVPIPVAPTIAAPDDLSAQVSGEGVRISWTGPAPPEAPAGLTYRFRIMRKPAGAPAYTVLNDVEPAAMGSYLDKTFGWETKYEYRITTVTQVASHDIKTTVEGADSKPVEVFTRDIYPPAQPVGLQAVFSSVGQKPFIDLTWAPNLESDLAGYNVFRRVDNGQFEKLNQQLVTTSSFRDENVEPGKKYIYSVSAVDLRGNESQRSAEASETVPDK
ncbi:MAG: hypothetical protein WCC92_05195 [Candidatus Korobacteraceae bacterium]